MMNKTRVRMINNNIDTYGSYPPYYNMGDEGYIDGYTKDFVVIVLYKYTELIYAESRDFRIIHTLENFVK